MPTNPLFVTVGMPGVGKSTLVDCLAQRGWPVVYFGGITLDEVRNRGLEPSQANEKIVRESLREIHGPEAYAKLSLPAVRDHLAQHPTIVDGLYSWSEYICLRRELTGPMYVIAVTADRQVRYARLSARKARPLPPHEAEQRDFAEIENIQKGGPIAIADFTLLNNGSIEELISKTNALVDKIMTQAS
jgi:dephospho-CoA kinase